MTKLGREPKTMDELHRVSVYHDMLRDLLLVFDKYNKEGDAITMLGMLEFAKFNFMEEVKVKK